MRAPTRTAHVNEHGFSMDVDPATRAIILIEERLRTIEERSTERSDAVNRIEVKVNEQQAQLNAVATDLAVLKSRHDSAWQGFWKIAAVMTSITTIVAAVVAWVFTHIPINK